MDVHLAARIMAAVHGGQVVLSQATRDLLAKMKPPRGGWFGAERARARR